MPKGDSVSLEWFKKENNIYIASMLALFAALFASAHPNNFSILGQPFNLGISVCLFIFCALLRIKYHLLEPRMKKFYSHQEKKQTDTEKSIEQLREELYLYSGYALCISIVHFYAFLGAFLVFLVIDQWYNKSYLNYQIKENPKWANGKFQPRELFSNWVYANYIDILLVSLAVMATKILNKNFSGTFAIFIVAAIFVELVLDWFVVNRDFYFDYYAE